MKELKLSTQILIYENDKELAEEFRVLLTAARDALQKSYAPYSGFQVGAAVQLKNRAILSGGNQENAAYPMCLCAERVVLAAASSNYPDEPVTAIAITVKSKSQTITQPAAPCGACRQVLCEAEDRSGQEITIILQGEEGPVYVLKSGKDLLPLSFDSSFLR